MYLYLIDHKNKIYS